MTIMNTELYEALVAAGAPDDKAKAAANVVEEQNNRFDKIDNRFDKMQSDMDNRFDKMQSDMDHRFDLVDQKFGELDKKIDQKFGELDKKIDYKADIQGAELKLLKWGIGFIVGGIITLLAIAARVLILQAS